MFIYKWYQFVYDNIIVKLHSMRSAVSTGRTAGRHQPRNAFDAKTTHWRRNNVKTTQQRRNHVEHGCNLVETLRDRWPLQPTSFQAAAGCRGNLGRYRPGGVANREQRVGLLFKKKISLKKNWVCRFCKFFVKVLFCCIFQIQETSAVISNLYYYHGSFGISTNLDFSGYCQSLLLSWYFLIFTNLNFRGYFKSLLLS